MNALINKFTLQVYNIGLVDANILEKGMQPGSIKWLRHKYHDRFFADPFLWYRDQDYYYLLVEDYCFIEERGKISLLKVEKTNFRLVEKLTLIKEPHHLAFPFCEEDGDMIIPEAKAGAACKEYRVSKDSHQITEVSTILDERIVDPILYFNSDASFLLGGMKKNPLDELYIYQKRQEDEKYSMSGTVFNPVIADRSHARNAGRIFKYRDMLLRPAQDCSKRYGYATKLMQIKQIDENGYEESEYMTLSCKGNPPFDQTMHTFNFYGDVAFVDGSRDICSARNGYYKARIRRSRNRKRNSPNLELTLR